MKWHPEDADHTKMDRFPRPTPDPGRPRDWVEGPPSGGDPPAPAEAVTPEAATVEAATPEAAAPEAGAPEAELSPVEAARARLRARGLLADGPTAPLPDAPERPGPTRPVLLDDVLAETDAGHDRAAPGDEWDVSSASSTLVPVSCPACRVDQQVPGDVTRFRCRNCDRAWRWAICEKCDQVGFPLERQETWRCSGCGHYTRSWWRTPTAAREALAVVTRRRDLVARSERRQATTARRRRVRVVAVAVVIAAVIAGGAAIAVTGGSSGPATGTAETCRQFDKLRAELGSGTLDGPELEASLRALQAASAGADPAVASATAKLVAVGRPSKAAFLVAQTELADACTAATD